MNALEGLRVVHTDGTHTPVEVRYVGTEPREAAGEIYLCQIWEVTSIIRWTTGDKWQANKQPDGCFIIRTNRNMRYENDAR